MPREKRTESYHFVRTENYCIEVEGHLAESRSDVLAGMRITTHKRADQKTVTTLTGRLRDQAELLGVLNSLYNLHLSILKVEIANSEKLNANFERRNSGAGFVKDPPNPTCGPK